MDQLTLSCMMCKMDSSTDSDSEISPRRSDTSTLGCVSSTPEGRTSHRTVALTLNSAARHGCYSLSLDPYDGGSEDSEESSGASREKRLGGCSVSGQRRRLLHHHAASLTVSEMVTKGSRDGFRHLQSMVHQRVSCSTKGIHAMDVELDGSGLDAGESSSCQISSCSSFRLCKRKELPPGGQVEAEPRKRQCVGNMEDEPDER